MQALRNATERSWANLVDGQVEVAGKREREVERADRVVLGGFESMPALLSDRRVLPLGPKLQEIAPLAFSTYSGCRSDLGCMMQLTGRVQGGGMGGCEALPGFAELVESIVEMQRVEALRQVAVSPVER